MKKQIVLLTSALLLSGCSQLESIPGKIPFLNLDGGHQESTDEKVDNPELNEGNSNQQNSEPEPETETVPEGPVLEAAYFNTVKEVDGKEIIQNPLNTMALVNKVYALPSTYIPNDLTRPDVSFSFGSQKLEKALLRKEAADALENMFEGARKDGFELFAVSGYRSYKRQNQLFEAEVQNAGEEKAAQAVAVPGNSEHQTGLSMDISSQSAGLNLNEQFGQTEEGKWLADNAHKYGFILRYPKGKEKITGYMYEPWHFRYVGKKAAAEIYKNNWTLEEYFEIVKKI
ncbi:M15 family metallopeptidase [Mesobacillus foraminis]|uniref:D-alanyl-D-alanine carboxypeptidase n=1 Tax=Mesobacillus foraminis TaxID=279826 RepID=A0A4R2BDP0_9BACI|nr:M15 family metallopeptidase [Mesobacillus foraminis]TCN24846.1 D-alanyl-D-alanine carboxypeptidase [Mesobacillus foraminis]